MRIIKCDRCLATVDNEPYYTVGQIEYTMPGAQHIRVVMDDTENESGYKTTESWVHYKEINFCQICWDVENFKNYLPKLS